MKAASPWSGLIVGSLIALMITGFGCSTSSRFRSPPRASDQEGLAYNQPETIDQVWFADDLDLGPYDTLVVLPTSPRHVATRDAKEEQRLGLVCDSLPKEIALAITAKNLFRRVTNDRASVSSATNVLTLTTAILRYSRGSSLARYVLSYGAGMPYIEIEAILASPTNTLLKFRMDRKGKWFGTGFENTETIEKSTSHQLAVDLADFINYVVQSSEVPER